MVIIFVLILVIVMKIALSAQNVAALWLVPNYTVWQHVHNALPDHLPKVVTWQWDNKSNLWHLAHQSTQFSAAKNAIFYGRLWQLRCGIYQISTLRYEIPWAAENRGPYWWPSAYITTPHFPDRKKFPLFYQTNEIEQMLKICQYRLWLYIFSIHSFKTVLGVNPLFINKMVTIR